MDITQEVDAIKKVVAALEPLSEDARYRVVEYAGKMLGFQSPAPGRHRSEAGTKPETPSIDSSKPGKPVSPQEYLRKYDYKVMTKRIAVVAVYLEREKKESRFSFKTITDAFKDAKEPKLPAHSQYSRAVAMNFLAKDGEAYYATSQAEALVDSYRAQAGGEEEKE
jgi:hypothetical protein